jgi:hypothetical protein
MVFPRRLLATTAGTGTGRKANSRYFDAHTVSIFAENMARRGSSPNEAIRAIMNRMDRGRARHRPELYNTALDICGHNGMLMDAATILHKASPSSMVLTS